MSVSREIDLQSTIYTFTKIEYKLNMPDAEESQLMARIVLLLSPTLLVCFSTLIFSMIFIFEDPKYVSRII